MKKGLVMEGGAMRGMFTAGVTDILMENSIVFDGAVGTSAGAAFGCNYKSRQIGRTIRYNKKYCRDKRFVSFRSLIFTGDLYGRDFSYRKLPDELDPFDYEAFEKNPMEFYTVSTNLGNGKAEYHKCTNGRYEDLDWIRASASMPLMANIVEIDGKKMLDGGVSDSVALRFMEGIGYEKNLVILTQPKGYEKMPNKFLPIIKIKYRKYPEFIEAVKKRHLVYNETIKYIEKREQDGTVFVIRPESSLNIGAAEKNPDELERVYQIGRKVAEKNLEKFKEWFQG